MISSKYTQIMHNNGVESLIQRVRGMSVVISEMKGGYKNGR